jgi:long-chain acyl-CoA synthetase
VSGNLADLVRTAAATHPDHPALLFHGETTTWQQLDRRTDALARGLRALGLARGDRVAVHLGNTPDFAAVYFGALRAGLVALPVNTAYTTDELAHVLADSGAAAVVTAATTLAEVLAVPAPPDHVVVAGGGEGGVPLASLEGDDAPFDGEAGGEDLAVLLYTSGTSGRPRGAMLSHRALLANLDQVSQVQPPVVEHDDVLLLVLPLFHVYGLNGGLGMIARHAATGVLVERFDPVAVLDDIRRHQVSTVVGAPPMWVAWSLLSDVGDAFASVRLALSGAAPLPTAVLHRVREVTGHHVFEGYGMTETAPVLTSTLMSEVPKPACIGRAIPGVELRLLDEDGEVVDEGDPGEIVVRGPNLFSGYWPEGYEGPDEDGWFGTGDVAVADEDGDLHLVDRVREMILVSGFNVYPREVEDVLAAHPAVAEVAVLGIPHPYTGESVKALVVRKAGTAVTGDDLVAHAARSLARFKCPTTVEFVTELPHTAVGKVAKGRLREADELAG